MPDDPISLGEGILKPIGALGALVALFKYMPTGSSPGKLVVWAIVCSLASGGIWAGVVHLSQRGKLPLLRKSTGFFGGNGKEPNGPESLIFTLVVFGPLTLAAMYLTSHLRGVYPLPGFVGYFAGTAVGAFAFYGGRIRDRVLKRTYSYFKRETWLVFWWAALLATCGFVGRQTALTLSYGIHAISLSTLGTQIALVVGILCISVTAFVALFSSDEYEKERGMFAGGFLALASLMALLVKDPTDLLSWARDILTPL